MKSCRLRAAHTQLLSEVTNSFHCDLLFTDSSLMEKGQLVCNFFTKTTTVCLICKILCRIKPHVLLPPVTTGVAKSTRTETFVIAISRNKILCPDYLLPAILSSSLFSDSTSHEIKDTTQTDQLAKKKKEEIKRSDENMMGKSGYQSL